MREHCIFVCNAQIAHFFESNINSHTVDGYNVVHNRENNLTAASLLEKIFSTVRVDM